MALLASPYICAQQQGSPAQLDGNEALFTVMAAINVAGFNAGLESGANSKFRKQVREAIEAEHPECLPRLRAFYDQHRQPDSNAELNQYISFALALEGPPEFKFRMDPRELPPDARHLAGFELLLADFYRQAKVNDLWKRSQQAYDQVIERYHEPVTKAVLQANGYLRNPTSGYLGRRFQIYVELLGLSDQVQTRSYKDDYFVVVMPSEEPQFTEIRHAYLHYLLDPLMLKYADVVARLKPLAGYAEEAPTLDLAYKDDFNLLATECLIKAIETRLAPVAERDTMLQDALTRGYILTPAFAEALVGFEKEVDAMRVYLPNLMEAVDLNRTEKSLKKVQFTTVARPKTVQHPVTVAEPALTGVAKELEDAESLYRDRQLTKARESYLRILEEPAAADLHAKAYYGLARIAALENNPEMAEKLFLKTLESSPDSGTKAWAYLYLGRLSDAAGKRDDAVADYKNVLAIDGAPPTVRNAAEKGLEQAFTQQK